MRTVEEILQAARRRGLILANLFELRTHPTAPNASRGTGEYQANFHHGSGWHDYGRGNSPVEALEDALERALGAKGPDNRPLPKEEKTKEPALDDLI